MKSHARRGADFDTAVAAARRSIEDLDLQIWRAANHPDGPQGSVVAMTEVLKALAVAEANELLDARHTWFERFRARECRKSKRAFVPESRHPSAEELAETLTGQCPAPPEATAYFRGALARRPYELWPQPEDEAGDWSDFPEQQQENV